MSQDILAKAVGLSRASIANIETGRQKVLLHHVYLLASALGCSSILDLIPTLRSPEGAPEVTGNKLGQGFTSKEIAQAMNVFLQAPTPAKGR